jgi:dimethylhistidine N-methyltransferase
MNTALQIARRYEPAPLTSRPLIALVFEGLSESPRQLPSLLLYDDVGSELFGRICEQPEYYPTRAESALIEQYADEIGEMIGPQAALVEYGAGSARKTQRLLQSLHSPRTYVPLDIDAGQLAVACREMRRRFATLQVHPLCQDFRRRVLLPDAAHRARRRVAFFAGSTIGNFRPLEAVELLDSIRSTMGPGGGLLIGVDLVKERAILERAYDDAAGVTAAFNLNVLARLNRELDATFDLAAFRHQAVWAASEQRIEMRLVSLRDQAPSIAGIEVALEAGEAIQTELCHKYTQDGFAALAADAGWRVVQTWVEPDACYSLQYLEATE